MDDVQDFVEILQGLLNAWLYEYNYKEYLVD